MKNKLLTYSCIIMTAPNPNDLNESINVKNPFGVETFDLMMANIGLSLIACSSMPIVWIILDIQREDENKNIKIVLNVKQLEAINKEYLEKYLKEKAIEELSFIDINI